MDNSTTTIVCAIIGSGIITTILTRIFSVIDGKKDKSTAIEDGLRWLMQDRLNFLMIKYIREAQADGSNSVSPARHKVIENGYKYYKALPNANGDIEELKHNFDKLEVDYNRKELP